MSTYLQSLFVDSRFRSSGSGTDFVLTLPENLNTTADTVVSCISVSFPTTFWTVEEGVRDQLAIQLTYEDEWDIKQTVTSHLPIRLIPGQYDGFAFATMLKAQINMWIPMPTPLPWFEVLYIPSENRLGISWDIEAGTEGTKYTYDFPHTWRFWSAEQLKPLDGNVDHPFSLSGQISSSRIAMHVFNLEDVPPTLSKDEAYISGYYDSFAGISVVYLKCDITAFKNVGPRVGGPEGVDRTVLARVPIQVDHGAYTHWSSNGYSFMWSSVQHSSQKQIGFQLTDADGNVLDLHGGTVSAHLLFHEGG